MTDIDWWLLDRYLAGECTAAQRAQVERWLAEDPAHRASLEALREVAGQVPLALSQDQEAELLASVWRTVTVARARSAASGEGGTRRLAALSTHRHGLGLAMKVAAAVILMVGGSLAGYLVLRRPAAPAAVAAPNFSTIATPRGQRLSLRLADGTLVTLAPGSTLRLASTYGVRDRRVQLTGEAAFTVTHDSTRPFAVHTAGAIARDLGTRFVVRAYAGDPTTDIVVAEGKVAVASRSSASPDSLSFIHDNAAAPLSSDSLLLGHGDRVRVTPDGRLGLTRGVALDHYFAWTEGRLVFANTPLGEAVKEIERWRDVEIRLSSPAIGERQFTTSFGSEPTSAILQVIATGLRLDIVQTGPRTYTLRAK